jgi:hypothetical protein
MDTRDIDADGELLFRLIPFRRQGNRASRPEEGATNGLRIIAHSSHMLGPRSQKQYSIRAQATPGLAETAVCMQ